MALAVQRSTIGTVAIAVCAAAVLSCSDKTAPEPATPLLGVAISRPLRNLVVGDTDRIQFQMYDSAYREVPLVRGQHSVRYVSGDTGIATVSDDGLVTARRIGGARIGVIIDASVADSGEAVLVVRPPQQIVVIATGNGDIDLTSQSTCNYRPYGIPGAGRYLPTSCYVDTRCQIRGGALVRPCVLDASGAKIRSRYDIGFIARPDSTIDFQYLNSAGQPVAPTSTEGPTCSVWKCFLYREVLQPDTIWVSVVTRGVASR